MTRICLAMTLALCFSSNHALAQGKKPYEKHDASALNDSLKHVINVGAKMFNDNGDHAGCYRLYQGSLLAVKPFLSGELQKRIDSGIATAERMPFYADRAFELRKVLDEIRASTKPGGAVAGKIDVPKDKGHVTGKLMYAGKPVAGGYFVTLVNKEGKKLSTTINKDGSFTFKTFLAPGEYRVAMDRIPDDKAKAIELPKRYLSPDTSGLTITVQQGAQEVILNLVK